MKPDCGSSSDGLGQSADWRRKTAERRTGQKSSVALQASQTPAASYGGRVGMRRKTFEWTSTPGKGKAGREMPSAHVDCREWVHPPLSSGRRIGVREGVQWRLWCGCAMGAGWRSRGGEET